ncbi:class Ib ribonucleoside-diphosphate reductase assembly flavoprotein NrdI [Mollicutes bacterium LVI A0039]|nr:class Ib ribonucleoside-diphosphate reductase assembly flavoprotein NrdI [Mollicutes bacterium LVI A0039]
MKVAYMTLTGNVRNFVSKLDTVDPLEIVTGDETIDEEFLLITFSPDAGEIPYEIEDFMETHGDKCLGVAASGDKAYGDDYTLVAETISLEYDVPIVRRFEFAGTDEDVEFVNQFIN